MIYEPDMNILNAKITGTLSVPNFLLVCTKQPFDGEVMGIRLNLESANECFSYYSDSFKERTGLTVIENSNYYQWQMIECYD